VTERVPAEAQVQENDPEVLVFDSFDLVPPVPHEVETDDTVSVPGSEIE
jgi:hypothetical protein